MTLTKKARKSAQSSMTSSSTSNDNSDGHTMKDYLTNHLILSQLLAGITQSNALLGVQIKKILADREGLYSTDLVGILRSARHEFAKLADVISVLLSDSYIEDQAVADFVVEARSIHQAKLAGPTKQYSQLYPLSNKVKFILYKASNMIRCSCFFAARQQKARRQLINSLAKETEKNLSMKPLADILQND